MRYKNEDANRYRVNFMIATEKLMDKLTVREFISYLEEKAEFEDTTHEYIDGKVVECKAYDLKEENTDNSDCLLKEMHPYSSLES